MSIPLAELFSDPWAPELSLQLNCELWPHDQFKFIDILQQAESHLLRGERAIAKALLEIPSQSASIAIDTDKILDYASRLCRKDALFQVKLGETQVPDFLRVKYQVFDTQSKYCEKVVSNSDCQFFSELVDYLRVLHLDYWGEEITEFETFSRSIRGEFRQNTQLDGFHFDVKTRFNCIVYLTDVGPKDGPFEYIPSLANAPYSIILKAIHMHVFLDHGLFSVRDLLSVPLEFRGSPQCAAFLDRHKIEGLVNQRKIITGRAGTYIVFCSHLLFHSGGRPLNGSRSAIFINAV
jgi:hypothetical protein